MRPSSREPGAVNAKEARLANSVDILEEAVAIAKQLGFEVRTEWLAEMPAGPCRIGAKYVLFVDLSTSASEQLSQVLQALCLPEFEEAVAALFRDGQLSPDLLESLSTA
ncbi:MAG TPA: hypothetical protein DDW52_07855 [Planctomycetaceae bacterium]|nr:hypothetical protein [Planctomycetaceae bacterium]